MHAYVHHAHMHHTFPSLARDGKSLKSRRFSVLFTCGHDISNLMVRNSLWISKNLLCGTYVSKVPASQTSSAIKILISVVHYGGHSMAPKTASAKAANAKVRYRQMIGGPIIL